MEQTPGWGCLGWREQVASLEQLCGRVVYLCDVFSPKNNALAYFFKNRSKHQQVIDFITKLRNLLTRN